MQSLQEFEAVVSMGHKLLIKHFGIDYPMSSEQPRRTFLPPAP